MHNLQTQGMNAARPPVHQPQVGMVNQDHRLGAAIPPSPPRHLVPMDLRPRTQAKVHDTREYFLSDADKAELLSSYAVIRIAKADSSNERDHYGDPVPPTWQRASHTRQGDLPKEQVTRHIWELRSRGHSLAEKLNWLDPPMRHQLDLAQADLDVENEDDRFHFVLEELEWQEVKVPIPPVVHYSVTRDERGRETYKEIVRSSSKSSSRSKHSSKHGSKHGSRHGSKSKHKHKHTRDPKYARETISMIGYYKRVPCDGQDIEALYEDRDAEHWAVARPALPQHGVPNQMVTRGTAPNMATGAPATHHTALNHGPRNIGPNNLPQQPMHTSMGPLNQGAQNPTAVQFANQPGMMGGNPAQPKQFQHLQQSFQQQQPHQQKPHQQQPMHQQPIPSNQRHQQPHQPFMAGAVGKSQQPKFVQSNTSPGKPVKQGAKVNPHPIAPFKVTQIPIIYPDSPRGSESSFATDASWSTDDSDVPTPPSSVASFSKFRPSGRGRQMNTQPHAVGGDERRKESQSRGRSRHRGRPEAFGQQPTRVQSKPNLGAGVHDIPAHSFTKLPSGRKQFSAGGLGAGIKPFPKQAAPVATRAFRPEFSPQPFGRRALSPETVGRHPGVQRMPSYEARQIIFDEDVEDLHEELDALRMDDPRMDRDKLRRIQEARYEDSFDRLEQNHRLNARLRGDARAGEWQPGLHQRERQEPEPIRRVQRRGPIFRDPSRGV